MVTRVSTVAFEGIEARAVDVQVQISPGSVVFMIVGLPDKAVAESRERVRSALIASGLALPAKRITVNLAPADVRKDGSAFDLPIALGILGASEQLAAAALSNSVFVGELGLQGDLRPVRGVLPMALAARNEGARTIVVPNANVAEAAIVHGIDVIGAGKGSEERVSAKLEERANKAVSRTRVDVFEEMRSFSSAV